MRFPGSPRLPIDRPPDPILIDAPIPPAAEGPGASINPLVASLKPERGRFAPPSSLAPVPSHPPSQLPSHLPPRGRDPRRRLLYRGLAAAALLAVGVGGAWAARHERATREQVVVRRAAAPSLKKADNGDPVRWHNDAVDVVLDDSLSAITPDAPSVYTAALDAWRASGAVLPSISTAAGQGRHPGYAEQGPNENVVLFAPYGWAKAQGALAVTVVTFESSSGALVDADLVVNGGGRFFAQFDAPDPSADKGEAVSIEGSSEAEEADPKEHKSARYDLQSILTHELGHFLGLGEDYDELGATMYVKTRPGETHKRMLTKTDASAITALYAEGLQHASGKAGCGGAQVAPGSRGRGGAGQAWIGFALAGLGLGLFAAGRSRSIARVAIRVETVAERAAWKRRRARARQVGGFLTAVGLAGALAPPAVSPASAAEAEPRGDAEVEVISARPRWADGVVETELTLRVATCHVGSCPPEPQKLVVMGGRMGRVTQVVGPYAVPDLGARVAVSLRGARGLMGHLAPSVRPH